jgi:hypothetical protein
VNPKLVLYKELQKIAYEIIDEIICPVCGISGVMADLWLADIETYTMEDDQEREAILAKIEEKYQLKENELNYIDSYTPLIMIALFLYLRDRKGPADASTTSRTDK